MTLNGWKIMRIGDTGQVQAGRQRSPSFTEGKDRPYLRVANVFDGYIDTTDVNMMKFTDKEYEIYRLTLGDILLNEGQTKELVGRPAMYKGKPENCCFQNTLIRYRAYSDYDENYMLKVFQYCMYAGKFSEIASQTTSVAHLGVSRFADLKVAIPPLPEQKKIAEILGSWDTAIEQLETLIEKKQLLKRGLMQKLLSGKVRFPEFEGEWETVKIGQFFEEISHKNKNNHQFTILSCSKVYGIVPQDQVFYKRIASEDLGRYKIVEYSNLVYDPMLLWDASIGFVESVDKGVISPAYNTFKFVGSDGL